jgi:hypothetical protein
VQRRPHRAGLDAKSALEIIARTWRFCGSSGASSAGASCVRAAWSAASATVPDTSNITGSDGMSADRNGRVFNFRPGWLGYVALVVSPHAYTRASVSPAGISYGVGFFDG